MAKRFIFRLQTVLKLRKRREDECRRVVAECLRRVSIARGRLVAKEDELRSAIESTRRDQVVRSLDPVLARRNRAYIVALRQQISQARSEVHQESDRLRQEQCRLTEASRQVKVIEKLKERQLQRHRQAQTRAERIEADEIAVQRFRRNTAPPCPESAEQAAWLPMARAGLTAGATS